MPKYPLEKLPECNFRQRSLKFLKKWARLFCREWNSRQNINADNLLTSLKAFFIKFNSDYLPRWYFRKVLPTFFQLIFRGNCPREYGTWLKIFNWYDKNKILGPNQIQNGQSNLEITLALSVNSFKSKLKLYWRNLCGNTHVHSIYKFRIFTTGIEHIHEKRLCF